MFNFLVQLLDWIYKKRCYFCKKVSDGRLMCGKCFAKIEVLKSYPARELDGCNVFCATIYSDEMQSLMRAIKYHNKKELSFFAGMVLKNFWEKVEHKEYDYEILPMPLHKNRQKKRGYNQSELIANEFAKYFEYKLNTKLARRIKKTPPLYNMNSQQRAEILDGVFEFLPENYSGKPILIIDDICTTGSTIKELIKELKRHGVEDITVLTCCTTKSKYQY